MDNKVKQLGQVFTPDNIVSDILNFINYKGNNILKKHIIDNSCGDGAFLKKIVEIYIEEYKKEYGNLVGVEQDLQKYIHGIEIDNQTYIKCLSNLQRTAFLQGVQNVKWDILNADTIEYDLFDQKMDYVVGNPPYVRVHNLGTNFCKIRKYKFCKKGMTDLFILFYEIGFNMLNSNGVLCYITPNSFYTSKAGAVFRQYIKNNKNLCLIADLGHYQPFKVSSYTTICKFDKNIVTDVFDFYKYNKHGELEFKEKLRLDDVFNNDKLILANKKDQDWLAEIQNYKPNNNKLIEVKNGFATLADKVFISDKKISNSIKVIKASTGKWYNCIFPYDSNANIIDFDELEDETKKYLISNENILKKRSLEKKSKWYGFGRSQAIKDVGSNKISINTTIKDLDSIKLNIVKSGEGVYSGLYILGSTDIEQIKKYVVNEEFIKYLKLLGKCKNGGYYTFSSNDLKKYLIFKLENINE